MIQDRSVQGRLSADYASDGANLKRRSLLAACAAHVIHDGYTDLLYVLLPIWKLEFGLSYAAVGLLRATYSAAMAASQVPVDRLTAPFGARASLVVGTLVAAAGFVIAGLSQGVVMLCVGLAIAGLGSSTQHPRSSVIVTEAFAGNYRSALGIYNFSGDLGKAMFPALTSLLLLAISWREATFVLAAIGLVAAAALSVLVPTGIKDKDAAASLASRTEGSSLGFAILLAIGALDTATRMGFLLFLPFILIGKQASGADVGIGLALVFAGGAFGKFVCGWLGQTLGLVGTVVATECMTALMIAAVPALPLGAVLALLPILGLALNGTSSVLYGTVPDVAKGDVGRAFALFYTGVIGGGALSPFVFGTIADAFGRHTSNLVAAATALTTIPLVLVLARLLAHRPRLS